MIEIKRFVKICIAVQTEVLISYLYYEYKWLNTNEFIATKESLKIFIKSFTRNKNWANHLNVVCNCKACAKIGKFYLIWGYKISPKYDFCYFQETFIRIVLCKHCCHIGCSCWLSLALLTIYKHKIQNQHVNIFLNIMWQKRVIHSEYIAI